MSDTFTACAPKRHREFSAGLTAAGGNGSIQVLGWRLHATLVGVAALVALPLVPVPAAAAGPHGRRLPFGTWVRFDVGAQGSFDSQGVFRFRTDDRVRLRVVDGFCRGDRFRVFDNGRPRFKTSNVPVDPTCFEQPVATTGPEAWHDHSYSRGRRTLGPGRHRIRVRSIRSPFGGSSAFIEILRIG
jgi:hypothetical protein